MTKRVAVIGDLHSGSTMALWPEGQAMQDGAIVQQNIGQKYLWECWQHMLKQVARMGKPILILNGDLIQGGNPRDGSLVSSLISVQTEAAEALLRPLVKLCSQVYVLRGSDWHEGRSSEYVERLAHDLGAVKAPDGSSSRWELYLDLGGRTIHVCHHISVSGLPWGQATAPARDALIMVLELARWYGAEAPNLRMIVRSHRHQYAQVHLPPDITSVTVPSWQLPGAYVYQRTPSTLPQIGWLEIEQTPSRLLAHPHLYDLPKRLIEKAEGK